MGNRNIIYFSIIIIYIIISLAAFAYSYDTGWQTMTTTYGVCGEPDCGYHYVYGGVLYGYECSASDYQGLSWIQKADFCISGNWKFLAQTTTDGVVLLENAGAGKVLTVPSVGNYFVYLESKYDAGPGETLKVGFGSGNYGVGGVNSIDIYNSVEDYQKCVFKNSFYSSTTNPKLWAIGNGGNSVHLTNYKITSCIVPSDDPGLVYCEDGTAVTEANLPANAECCTNSIKNGIKTSGVQHISWSDDNSDTACCVNAGDCVVGNTCRSFNYYHTGLNSGGDDNIARCGSNTYWRDVDESSSRCTGAGLDFIPAGDSANVGEYGSSANGGDGTTECCGDDADEYEIDSYCCDDSSDCVDDDDDDGDEDCINTNTAYSDDGGALSNMHCSNTNTNPCKDSGDICTTSGSYTCKMDSFTGELEWHLTSADDVREYCDDGIDNDCDTAIDADDTECRLLTGTVYQEISPDLEPEAGDIHYGNRYYEFSEGATIVIKGSNGEESIYGGDITDENGEYGANLSALQDYYIVANKTGYQSVDPKFIANADTNIEEDFYLPIGMGCTDACYRYDTDGNAVCDASCDGVAGCVFNNSYVSDDDRMIKEICDGQLSGMVFSFNSTHEVKCCGSIRRFLDACEEEGTCPNGGSGNKRVVPWWGIPYNKTSVYGSGGRPEFIVKSEEGVTDVASYSRVVNLNGELVTMYISVW